MPAHADRLEDGPENDLARLQDPDQTGAPSRGAVSGRDRALISMSRTGRSGSACPIGRRPVLYRRGAAAAGAGLWPAVAVDPARAAPDRPPIPIPGIIEFRFLART